MELKDILTIVGILVCGFLFVRGFMIEPHRDNKNGNSNSSGSGEISSRNNSSDGKL